MPKVRDKAERDYFASCHKSRTFGTKDNLPPPPSQGEAEDSQSLVPLLKGENAYSRDHIIYQSSDGLLAIRQGDWKLVEALGSGGFSVPRRVEPTSGAPIGQLYNL